MKRVPLSVLSLLLMLTGRFAPAQQAPPIEVQTTPVAPRVFMLTAAGGNLCLAIGEDGALLVDSDYERLAPQVLAAIRAQTDKPLRFVLNTHWHFDHVGGNQPLAAGGAVVVAHENVRRRMSSEQVLGGLGRKVPPAPEAARPKLTYTGSLTLHWGDDTLQVIHPEPAHTDGDSFVHFAQANVLHMGDVYFNGVYPFIDVNAGGSIDGMVAAVDRALALVNAETRIIPGHGPLSTPAELRAYRHMLVDVRTRVQALVQEGKSRAEVIAARPTRDLDERWARGGITPDVFVGLVYDSLARP